MDSRQLLVGMVAFAAPRMELRVEPDGAREVRCLLQRTNPPLADQDYDASDLTPAVVTCRRTGDGLTVRVWAGQDAGSSPSPDATLAVLDDAWDSVG